MHKFRQHIPDCMDGYTPVSFDFENYSELFKNPLVKNAIKWGNFYRFSLSYKENRCLLMGEYDNGKVWYVIGFIDHDALLGDSSKEAIPIWHFRKEND